MPAKTQAKKKARQPSAVSSAPENERMERPTRAGRPLTDAQIQAAEDHRFEPTKEQRELVMLAVATGYTHKQIARIVAGGISEVTLRKHFRDELDEGADRANLAVSGNLFSIATSKTHKQALGAARFWLQTRAGWKLPAPEKPSTPPADPDDPFGHQARRGKGALALPGAVDGQPVEFTLVIGDRDPSATDGVDGGK